MGGGGGGSWHKRAATVPRQLYAPKPPVAPEEHRPPADQQVCRLEIGALFRCSGTPVPRAASSRLQTL